MAGERLDRILERGREVGYVLAGIGFGISFLTWMGGEQLWENLKGDLRFRMEGGSWIDKPKDGGDLRAPTVYKWARLDDYFSRTKVR